jgi:hypothetical protein
MADSLYKVLQQRSIFFYLLFLGYLAFVNPYLMARLSTTASGHIDVVLGWFLLILLFLELWGFWLKHPIMVYYTRYSAVDETPSKKFLSWLNDAIMLLGVIFFPIFRIGMGIFLYITATQIGGLDPGDGMPLWQALLFGAGFLIVIIKELGMIVLFFTPYGLRGASNDTYPTLSWHGRANGVYPSELEFSHLLRDALGDLVLLAFTAVAYTVLWDGIGLTSPVQANSFKEYILAYLGLSLYFLMTMLPLRSVYLFQAITTPQTGYQRIWMVIRFSVLFLVAISSYPRI